MRPPITSSTTVVLGLGGLLGHDADEHAMGLNNRIICQEEWQRKGGCDESLSMWEDADVHIRLARDGARFRHCQEVLTFSLPRGDALLPPPYGRCRVPALEGYATGPRAEDVGEVLAAAQAEIAAANLAALQDDAAARRALALCRSLGGAPPTSRHPGIRMLKSFVPPLTLLKWQCRHRMRRQS